MHVAAEIASESNARLLLKAGADETAVHNEGKPPSDVIRDDCCLLVLRMLLNETVNRIRTLLVNAPKDRAWARRGFLVLCRAFPERVRLQLQNDACRAAPSMSDDPSFSRATSKRAATTDGRGGGRRQPAAAHPEERAMAFKATISRLLGLEAGVVFRTIVEFL